MVFEEKYKSKIPKWSAFAISSAILLALQETGQTGNIKTGVQMALILIIAFVVYDGKKRLKALFVVIYSLFVALSKLLSYFAFSLFINKIFDRNIIKNNVDYTISKNFYIKNIDKYVLKGEILTLNKFINNVYAGDIKNMKKL